MTVACRPVPGERDDDDRIHLEHDGQRLVLTFDEARGLQIHGLPAALTMLSRVRAYRTD